MEKENWSLGISAVNMKQGKVLCLNYILTIVTPLGMFSYFSQMCRYLDWSLWCFWVFMVVHKCKNNSVFSCWKNDNFHCYFCVTVIKYQFFIFSHLCYYSYQWSRLLGLLFHMLSISTIWPQFRSFGHLQGYYFHSMSLLLPRVTKMSLSQSALADKEGSPGVNRHDLYAVDFSEIAL